jgi:limonene-1,2-epoxide hydrolase
MARPTADEFVAALRRVEDHGDVEAMAALFADSARVSNPTDAQPHTGVDGARKFWDTYRRSFRRVHSRFHRALESDGAAMLEWTSECETAAGVSTSYDGVSVFETADGKITRFTAYFDPADLSAHAQGDAVTPGHHAHGAAGGAYGAAGGR